MGISTNGALEDLGMCICGGGGGSVTHFLGLVGNILRNMVHVGYIGILFPYSLLRTSKQEAPAIMTYTAMAWHCRACRLMQKHS